MCVYIYVYVYTYIRTYIRMDRMKLLCPAGVPCGEVISDLWENRSSHTGDRIRTLELRPLRASRGVLLKSFLRVVVIGER